MANFKMGFHGKPSMKQLHLHVISDDLNSPAMKHSKHYNTFTTPYFLDVHDFIDTVRRVGYYPVRSPFGAFTICRSNFTSLGWFQGIN